MLNHRATPALLSALAALITFSITLGGTFIYDDLDVFANDPRVHHPDQWKKYWTDSYNGGVDNLYRPLVSMTYAIQWKLHGDALKWPYHAVNLLLHAAVAACVAEFTRRLLALAPSPCTRGEGGGEGSSLRANEDPSPNLSPSTGRGGIPATFAGLLFATHPVHVEAVANVIGRAELMSALGILGAMILFLHRPLTVARSFAIFGCCLFAILSKEQGLLTPFLLLALGMCVGFRSVDARERKATIALLLLMTWCIAGYVFFRESILKFDWDRGLLEWTINPLLKSFGPDRFLMPVVLLGHYASLLIAPIKLSPDYGGNVIGFHARSTDPYLWFGFTTAAACVFAFVIALKKNWRLTIFCLIALALSYSIISNFFFLIGTNFGERLMYLPSVFFCIIIAMTIAWFLPRRIAIGLTMLLVVLGGARSISYARRWNDRLSFYQWASKDQPRSIRLRMLIIAELQSQKRLDEASQVARDARDLLPEYSEIWIQSADVELARGDVETAEKFLHRAVKLPGHPGKAAGRLAMIEQKRAATQTSD